MNGINAVIWYILFNLPLSKQVGGLVVLQQYSAVTLMWFQKTTFPGITS